MVKFVPEGTQQVVPYLIVADPAKTIDFLKAGFGAKEIDRSADDAGRIHHASVKIGDSVVMMGGASEQHKPMQMSIYVYVPNTDETYRRCLAAGAKSLMEPADQFYGDRNAGVLDEAGNTWWIGTHFEDIPDDVMKQREKEWMATKT